MTLRLPVPLIRERPRRLGGRTGSDDGLVYLTRDGGKHWSKVTPPGMPDFGRVSLIDASPLDAPTAYVAVKNYQNDDRRPYIFTANHAQLVDPRFSP